MLGRLTCFAHSHDRLTAVSGSLPCWAHCHAWLIGMLGSKPCWAHRHVGLIAMLGSSPCLGSVCNSAGLYCLLDAVVLQYWGLTAPSGCRRILWIDSIGRLSLDDRPRCPDFAPLGVRPAFAWAVLGFARNVLYSCCHSCPLHTTLRLRRAS